MRSPANALGAVLRQATQEGREHKAAEIYAPEAVRTRLTSAAAKGFGFAVIGCPDGLDLRDTQAGVAVLKWLTENKLAGRWEARPGGSGIDGTVAYDLIVSWQEGGLPAGYRHGEGGAGPAGG